MRSRTYKRTAPAFYAALAALLLLFGSCRRTGKNELPVLLKVPDFRLQDSAGAQFHSASLKGRPWVLSFFFASCQGPCPVINANLAVLLEQYEGTSLEAVSITVDPANDTPQALREYGIKLGADPKRWHFLTGTRDEISRIQNELRLATADDPDTHSVRVFLIDPALQVRGSYSGIDKAGMQQLAAAAGKLVKPQ